jgi:membrane protein DedA with SNARE-associated domain/membrane-associated phospholipid phosphatase
MLDVINDWVGQYGYVLVAVFLTVEAAGIPIPGETALVTASAVAGRGTMHIVGVMIAACIGTIAGGHLGFWLGVRGGNAFVTKYGKYVGLNDKRLEITKKFFEQHGAKTVATGRFVAFVRSFMGIFAGLSGMPLRTFALYNAIGAVVWVLTFGILGYVFGRNLPVLIHYIGRVSLLVAILIALIAGVVFFWRWYNRNRAAIVAALDKRWELRAASERMRELRSLHPVMWRLISGRFAQSEYLALHLVIGFAASLAVIIVFAFITEGLVDSSPLTRFDVGVAARLRESAPPDALRVFTFVSALGGRGMMTLLLFGGGLLYALRRRGLEAVAWCVAFLGAAVLDAALRAAVHRSELPFADVVVVGWGTGLTSGHALGVLVGYGMLAYLVATLLRGAAVRALVVTLAIALVAAITASRLFLGQQYVSDTTAGLAAGLLWLTACISGIEVSRQRHWER